MAVLLAGCAATPLGPTVQVMPGPGKTLEAFQADNSVCKAFAANQVAGQADAAKGGAVGAGAGATLGAVNNTADQQGIQAQYDNAFSQCMYAKGDQVADFAPVAVASAPAPVVVAPDPLIRATQTELIRLGYLSGGADGYTGPKTRTAISGFERASGLPVDSGASPRLLAKLQATPTNAAAATAAPSAWVQPAGTQAATPASASASAAPSGWVAPAKAQ